jgi:hypothetical protein
MMLAQNSMIALDRYLQLIAKSPTRRDTSGGGLDERIARTGCR